MSNLKPIEFFQDEHRFLSNFYPCVVYLGDLSYISVENAYQASKSLDLETRKRFQQYTSGQSKRAGSKLELREDWEEVKVEIMSDLVVQKFSDPILRQMLLGTGTASLIEGNTWHDNYWGECYCGTCGQGQNLLGKILMTVRENSA